MPWLPRGTILATFALQGDLLFILCVFSPQPSVASSRASAIPGTPMRMSLLVLHTPSIPGLPRERHRSQASGDTVAHPGCASTTLSHPSLIWCSSACLASQTVYQKRLRRQVPLTFS